MEYISNTLGNLVEQTAFMNLTFGNLIMIAVACFFLYLAIRHGFEPLLLVPIAFGMLLVNIYPDIMLHAEDSANGTGGLLYDRLWTIDREPEEFPSGCGSTVWYFRRIPWSNGNGIL